MEKLLEYINAILSGIGEIYSNKHFILGFELKNNFPQFS